MGKSLAARMLSADPAQNVAVKLNVDPEVCRLGCRTLNALEAAKMALESTGRCLGTTEGIRLGLVVPSEIRHPRRLVSLNT